MRAVILWSYAIQSIVAATVHTDKSCKTRLGPYFVDNVPSSTRTINIPLTTVEEICLTPVKTITPLPKTLHVAITKIATSTIVITAAPKIVTITRTNTVTKTKSRISIITLTTFIATTTISTSITTVPTPAGFTPISQKGGYVPKQIKRNPILDFSTPWDELVRVDQPGGIFIEKQYYAESSPIYSPTAYPTAVECVKTIKPVTTQTISRKDCASKFQTLPITTITSTSTVSAISTSTRFVPGVTSQITISKDTTTFATTIVTSTSVVNSTYTKTIIAPKETFYAACAKNNFITKANGGKPIGEVVYNHGYEASNDVVSVDTRTAYDCCVACQKTKNCAGSNYYASGDFTFCDLVVSKKCDSNVSPFIQYNTVHDVDTFSGYFISNGPCGYFNNGGGP